MVVNVGEVRVVETWWETSGGGVVVALWFIAKVGLDVGVGGMVVVETFVEGVGKGASTCTIEIGANVKGSGKGTSTWCAPTLMFAFGISKFIHIVYAIFKYI